MKILTSILVTGIFSAALVTGVLAQDRDESFDYDTPKASYCVNPYTREIVLCSTPDIEGLYPYIGDVPLGGYVSREHNERFRHEHNEHFRGEHNEHNERGEHFRGEHGEHHEHGGHAGHY
jgi:hypothetical protein